MNDLSYITQTDPERFMLQPGQPTMKAVLTTGNGGYEKLDYTDVPVPVPGPDDVLLKVLAAGVNNTEINTLHAQEHIDTRQINSRSAAGS